KLMKPWQSLKHRWSTLILALVLVVLFAANFTPGTYLAGWDNLMPEFNIGMNLKRSFLAVWQEYQGLGLVGGMGHATDLIRQLILLPFILVLPQNLIRYLWHFSMLALGSFSVFYGLKKYLKFSPLTSLTGALFYLLNFGSIQNFWAPLETFSTFWGFFPLLIFSLWNYLDRPSRRSLRLLILVNILAVPSFYVQTIFLVYLACLAIVILSFLLAKPHRHALLSSSLSLFLIFLVNSFWLLPFFYFLLTNLHNPTAGIGNFMSSESTFARNQHRGYVSDFLLLRGYYYDFPSADGYLMAPWVKHFSSLYPLVCGYALSVFVIIGLFRLLLTRSRQKMVKFTLFGLLFLSALALLNAAFPFRELNALIRQVSLLDQVFRSPFTKFIVPAIFTFTLLFSYGLEYISGLLAEFKYSSKVALTPHFLSLIFLFIYIYPVFTGNYISRSFRVVIPNSYFQLFDYFKSQPKDARIMNLPQGSFWGWTNYRWKLSGSGFLWYGLEQPVMDRAFDAWNLKNEQYYWELQTALQKRDPNLLTQVINKYNIGYVIYDNDIYFPDEKIYAKNSLSTESVLDQITSLTQVKKIGNLIIYKTNLSSSPFVINRPVSVNTYQFAYQDPVFSKYGDYVASAHPSDSFPFISLFTNRLQSENPFTVSKSPNLLTISSPAQSQSYLVNDFYNTGLNHSPLLQGQQELQENGQKFFRLFNLDNNSLFVFNFPDAGLNQSFMARIVYRHLSGLPLETSIVSNNIENKYVDTKLDKPQSWSVAWFVIPAHQYSNFDNGINIIFNNSSLNEQPSVNDIQSVSLYPFPYDSLQSSETNPISPSPLLRQSLSAQNSLFYYSLSLPPRLSAGSFLVLPQSYSSGWLAFTFRGLRPVLLSGHTQADNWANAWPLDASTAPAKLFILFWPQLLEFLGLSALIGTVITAIILKK
ncbi:MAG TPA: hypothetical protein VF828_00355, partial [Patescibacteria group bacterium]